jgi:hypothetical protein
MQVLYNISDYEAIRAVNTAKYKELIWLSYIINPNNPFITNSRALSPTPGGETIIVAVLELPPLSPSTIIKPLVGLEVII